MPERDQTPQFRRGHLRKRRLLQNEMWLPLAPGKGQVKQDASRVSRVLHPVLTVSSKERES